MIHCKVAREWIVGHLEEIVAFDDKNLLDMTQEMTIVVKTLNMQHAKPQSYQVYDGVEGKWVTIYPRYEDKYNYWWSEENIQERVDALVLKVLHQPDYLLWAVLHSDECWELDRYLRQQKTQTTFLLM